MSEHHHGYAPYKEQLQKRLAGLIEERRLEQQASSAQQPLFQERDRA